MWAPLLFMVPGGRRLLRGSGQEPGRLPRPAPGSTQCRPLHLRPPGRWRRRRAPEAPRVQVRCAGPLPRGEGRGAETRGPRGAGAFYIGGGGGGAALSAGILARVASCGAAPRDRRRGPLGKGGAAALLLGLPLSLSRCFPPAERGLRPRSGATSFRSATRLPPL